MSTSLSVKQPASCLGSASYTMCSAKECEERVQCNEISPFEKTNGTMDPRKMVKKYRRSAAGTNNNSQSSPRSMDQLNATVDYLIDVLLMGAVCERTDSLCFVDCVDFLEDRLRAVQVEYTMLSLQSGKVQYKIAKAHILILYLLSDHSTAPRKQTRQSATAQLFYERRFGITALQTALSSYWLGQEDPSLGCCVSNEMMSFSILTQLNEYFMNIESEVLQSHGSPPPLPTVWFPLVTMYRKHHRNDSSPLEESNPLHWTMGFLTRISNGYWQCALSWLRKPPTASSFYTLARCCVSGMVPLLQWLILERYNRILSKNQTIPMAELQRLLFFDSITECRQFMQDVLPCDKEAVTFKAAAILPPPQPFARRCDAFVFGNGDDDHTMMTSKDGIVLPGTNTLQELLLQL